MKTINFKLSKRLNELWLLDNMETEYCYNIDKDILPWFYAKEEYSQIVYKTLTLGEIFKYLPKFVDLRSITFKLEYDVEWYWWLTLDDDYKTNKDMLVLMEYFLEFLLDNNLLTK